MARKKPTPAEEPPQMINFDAAKNAEVRAGYADQMAGYAANSFIIAESMGIKTKPLEHFTLSPAQREVLLAVPDLAKPIKAKLKNDKASFTVTEVGSMTMALAKVSIDDDPLKQIAVLLVAKHLTDRLQEGIEGLSETKLQKRKIPKTKADAKTVYQFKITLVGSKPPIWRRIQVEDCTLDKLHEHIQTAMGWTNSHLHHFRIGKQLYGDPMLMEEDMEEMNYKDSTHTKISKLLPKTGKRFSFTYEYDFGDGWEHEILFEGSLKKEPGKKYPLCLEGKRACPPEDCGGVWGYADFLEAIRNKKHEQHKEMLEWIGGRFDSEEFDPAAATKEMKKGLPDWRE